MLEWWWGLLLLPLPWLVRKLLPAAAQSSGGVTVPLLAVQAAPPRAKTVFGTSQQFLIMALLCLCWVSLVLAVCRPYWLGDAQARLVSGRDMMLAVDISGSMREDDMQLGGRTASRLDVLKTVLGQFITGRAGDRLGLVLFGSKAYPYVPLTFDLETLNQLLQEASVGLAGRHTALGDAIGTSLKVLREQNSRHKVIVLVTDGHNTSGLGDPLHAARAALLNGVTVHTVGIGNDAQSLRQQLGYVPDGAALDEITLQNIAATTGGSYFRATDTQTLQKIYQRLNALEPIAHNDRSYRPQLDLTHWFLALAVLALLLIWLQRWWWSWREQAHA